MSERRPITDCGKEYGCDSMYGHGSDCYVPMVENLEDEVQRLRTALELVYVHLASGHEDECGMALEVARAALNQQPTEACAYCFHDILDHHDGDDTYCMVPDTLHGGDACTCKQFIW